MPITRTIKSSLHIYHYGRLSWTSPYAICYRAPPFRTNGHSQARLLHNNKLESHQHPKFKPGSLIWANLVKESIDKSGYTIIVPENGHHEPRKIHFKPRPFVVISNDATTFVALPCFTHSRRGLLFPPKPQRTTRVHPRSDTQINLSTLYRHSQPHSNHPISPSSIRTPPPSSTPMTMTTAPTHR